jgi:hypothetical protein
VTEDVDGDGRELWLRSFSGMSQAKKEENANIKKQAEQSE